MTTTTQCPACGTRFKATQAQLEAYRGMVRCGHCHAAFNAIENRTSTEPSPQLDLPIVLEDVTPPASPATAPYTPVSPGPATPAVQPPRAAQATSRPQPAPSTPTATEPPELVQEDEDEDEYEEDDTPRTWPWAAGVVLLTLLALAQTTYLFRTELASRLPGLKPALVAACAKLRCTVPLPRDIDQMAIESSSLEADPAQPGVITISITLHNSAPYPEAYPNLELTLTDFNDMPVGRRIFRPEEYLKDTSDVARGLAGNRDNSIRLAIDATSLQAAGYRLYLSY